MEHAAVVHHPLQAVSFPSKHVVSMSAVASTIGVAPYEWLRTIGWPHIGESGRIPHRFVC